MRQIKIENQRVKDIDGNNIGCPMSFNSEDGIPCQASCAWFRIVEVETTRKGEMIGEINLCKCGDKIIGEVAK